MTCTAPERAFPRLKPHDPSGGTCLRTIELPVDVGDSLTVDTALALVNADGSALDLGETITLTLVSIGRISTSPQGDVWGINYKVRYGSKKGVDYLLVLTPWLASQPDAPQYDQTFALPVIDT